MSITPVTPSAGPLPPSGTSAASSAPTRSLDNQSTYSSEIANGNPLSILGFSSIVLTASNDAGERAWANQQYNANSRQALYNALIDSSNELLGISNRITAAASLYTNEYTTNVANLISLNTQLTTFNNGVPSDQSAVNTLNAAINTYNAGLPYNIAPKRIAAFMILRKATDNYNSYAASRNITINQTNSSITGFNSNTASVNAQVAIANQLLVGYIPQPLTTQGAYGTSSPLLPIFSSPPTTNFSNTTSFLPPAGNTMNPDAANSPYSIILQAFLPIFTLLFGQFAVEDKNLKNQSNYVGFVQFYLNSKLPFLPPAFVNPVPKPELGGGGRGIGGGSGVSLASIISSLSSPLMESIISQGIFTTDTQLASYQSANYIATLIQYFGLQSLAQIGLLAGLTTSNLFTKQLASIDIDSPGVTLASGLALASEISQLVSSGSILKGIQAILANAYPGLSASDLQSTASKLATVEELFLLESGLLQLAQALQSPQLFGQVLSTLNSAQQFGATNPQASLSEVLNNPASAAAISNSVSANLAKEAGIESSVAQSIVNQGINEAYVNGQLNEKAYINSLIQNGITEREAINSANILQTNLQSEILGYGILENSVASNRLSHSLLSNELINQIVSNKPNITNRQLRDELVKQFIANGATYDQALEAATGLVTGNPVATGSVSSETLANSLYTSAEHLFSTVGFNATESQNFANQLVSTVIGQDIPGSQTSIRTLIDERLNSLIQSQDATITNQAKDTLLTFLAPTLELYVFAERLRDPANTFLLSTQTGIIYDMKQPSNYLKNVDINV